MSWQLAAVAAVCSALVSVLTAMSMSLGVCSGSFKFINESTVSIYNFQLNGHLINNKLKTKKILFGPTVIYGPFKNFT